MTPMQTRFALFIIFCLGSRFTLAYIAKIASPYYLRIMGYLALLPAIGFIYIFATGSRQTGAEVMGEKIWWNFLRPVHAILYLSFAYNAINIRPYAWGFLFADVLLGAVSFLVHHYRAGDFAKIV
jgi:hypothetical protein